MTEAPAPTEPATTIAEPAWHGMVCRADWGARPAKPGGRPHTIRWLTVHHSAGYLADGEDPTEHLLRYQRVHQDDNGWVDVAYHVAVDRAGTAYELRDTGLAGDTNTNYDPAGHFLVLAIGNFEEQEPTAAQLDGIARVLRWGEQTFGASLQTVSGHRDHAATACPGTSLYARLSEVRSAAGAIPTGATGITAC